MHADKKPWRKKRVLKYRFLLSAKQHEIGISKVKEYVKMTSSPDFKFERPHE